MPLFTIILEYGGGTYIRQEKAKSSRQACSKWLARLKPGEVVGLREKGIAMLRQGLLNDGLVAINRLKKCWCSVAVIRGNLALLHIVETHDV